MKITSKGRYAVRIMAELAKNSNEYMPVVEIAEKQNITPKYLEKIISMLAKAKLITSTRGASGGYKLLKEPKEYTIAEILKVTGDLPNIAPCLLDEKSCPNYSHCDSIGCWEKLNKLIYDYLAKITLEDLLNKNY